MKSTVSSPRSYMEHESTAPMGPGWTCPLWLLHAASVPGCQSRCGQKDQVAVPAGAGVGQGKSKLRLAKPASCRDLDLKIKRHCEQFPCDIFFSVYAYCPPTQDPEVLKDRANLLVSLLVDQIHLPETHIFWQMLLEFQFQFSLQLIEQRHKPLAM